MNRITMKGWGRTNGVLSSPPMATLDWHFGWYKILLNELFIMFPAMVAFSLYFHSKL